MSSQELATYLEELTIKTQEYLTRIKNRRATASTPETDSAKVAKGTGISAPKAVGLLAG